MWHKFQMTAISTENSSQIYLQFLFSIKHSSWLNSRKANSWTFMYVYIATPDKKHKKLGKMVQQFRKSAAKPTSEMGKSSWGDRLDAESRPDIRLVWQFWPPCVHTQWSPWDTHHSNRVSTGPFGCSRMWQCKGWLAEPHHSTPLYAWSRISSAWK